MAAKFINAPAIHPILILSGAERIGADPGTNGTGGMQERCKRDERKLRLTTQCRFGAGAGEGAQDALMLHRIKVGFYDRPEVIRATAARVIASGDLLD